MGPPRCDNCRYLLVRDHGLDPAPGLFVGVCEGCGEFLLSVRAGRAAVATRFRLTPRQLRAAARGVPADAKGVRG